MVGGGTEAIAMGVLGCATYQDNLVSPTNGLSHPKGRTLWGGLVAGKAQEVSIFGIRLREARERLGISQMELGRRVSMDPDVASPRVNQYENGVHIPHHTTAARMARELGVPLAYLYAEDDQLARWILAWTTLTVAERRRILQDLEA
ncbi:hypothetical protein PAGU2595_013200 [Lysobacter xanthus]